MEESKSHLESEFQEERRSLQAEIERINSQLQEVDFTAAEEQKCSAQLKRELRQAQTQSESESTVRRIMEDRTIELSADNERQHTALAQALADATEQSRAAEQSWPR